MATQLFANNAASVLASSLTSVATSLTVTTGHGTRFPSPSGGDYFLATLCQQGSAGEINFEIVKVTARSTDSFTIVRAQESTTALAYNAGDKFELRLTKGTMETLQSSFVSLDGYKVDTSIAAAPLQLARFVENPAGLAWSPAVQADFTRYSRWNDFLPSVGVTGGTAAQKWATEVYGKFGFAQTTAGLANSHFVSEGRIVWIPSGLTAVNSANATPAGGPWAVMDAPGGTPNDPNYQEIGGFGVTLQCETAGNYLEGIASVTTDYVTSSASAVPCIMASGIFGVSKNAASNTYRSTGITINSFGSQQSTYAPLSAVLIAGGWQYGLDLSSGAYNAAAIRFPNGHTITHDSTHLYINAGGVGLNVSAGGCGLSSGSFVGDLNGDVAADTVVATTSVLSSGTGGIGYTTGAGGTVTQATDKSTDVTLNKVSGRITMNAASLASNAVVHFNLNNSLIATTDTVSLSAYWGAVSGVNYRIELATLSSGLAVIRVTNISGGARSEAIQINFNVHKGATS